MLFVLLLLVVVLFVLLLLVVVLLVLLLLLVVVLVVLVVLLLMLLVLLVLLVLLLLQCSSGSLSARGKRKAAPAEAAAADVVALPDLDARRAALDFSEGNPCDQANCLNEEVKSDIGREPMRVILSTHDWVHDVLAASIRQSVESTAVHAYTLLLQPFVVVVCDPESQRVT